MTPPSAISPPDSPTLVHAYSRIPFWLLWVAGLPAFYFGLGSLDVMTGVAALLTVILGRGSLLRSVIDPPKSEASWCFGLLIGLALVSLIWSPVPLDGAAIFLGLSLNLMALAVLRALFAGQPSGAALLMAWALAATAGISALDSLTSGSLSAVAGRRPMELTQAYVLTTMLLVGVPVIGILLEQQNRAAAAMLGFAIVAAIALSRSQSASLGLAAAISGGVVAMAFPIWRKRLLILAAVAVFIGTPLALGAVLHLDWEPLARRLSDAHLAERLDIWRAALSFIDRAPIFGNGFGASVSFGPAANALNMHDLSAVALAHGHPHNHALQILIDLGFAGSLIAAVGVGVMVRRFEPLPRARLVAAYASLAATLAIGLVNHSLYAGNFVVSAGLGLILLHAFGRADVAPNGKKP